MSIKVVAEATTNCKKDLKITILGIVLENLLKDSLLMGTKEFIFLYAKWMSHRIKTGLETVKGFYLMW